MCALSVCVLRLIALLSGLTYLVVAQTAPLPYPDFPYTPLSGYVSTRTYAGPGCSPSSVLSESLERVGVCALWINSDGQGDVPPGTVGSHVTYYCQDSYCFTDASAYGCPTAAPTNEPSPRKITRNPTRRPSVLPTPAPSPAPTTSQPSSSTALIDGNTFVVTELTFPFSLNCTGDFNTTYWSLYTCSPGGIVQSGRCDASPDPVGYYGSSSITFTQSEQLPPLSFSGLVTTHYRDAESCQKQRDPISQVAYPGDTCLPSARKVPSVEDVAGAASVQYINNHDWITRNEFSAPGCRGKVSARVTIESTTCFAQPGPLVLHGQNASFAGTVFSRAFTSPPSPALLLQLSYAAMWFDIKTSLAAVSSFCSLLILLVLVRIGKWTFFNQILVPLAGWQLIFDLAMVSAPRRDVVVQEVHVLEVHVFNGDGSEYVSFAARDFFTEWAVLNVFLITNIITLAVGYIFRYQRSLQLTGVRLGVLLGVIALAAAVLPLALLALRIKVSDGVTEYNNEIDYILQAIAVIKAASIVGVNVLVTCAALATLAAQRKQSSAAQSSLSPSAKATTAPPTSTRAASRSTLANVLIQRLLPYPLIQTVTQFAVLWDYFRFKPKVLGNSASTHTTDDAFYKSEEYTACWFLQSLLVPSAGLLFFLSYVAYSPEARSALCGEKVGRKAYVASSKARGAPFKSNTSSNKSKDNVEPNNEGVEEGGKGTEKEITGSKEYNANGRTSLSREPSMCGPDEIPEQDLALCDDGEIVDMLERSWDGARKKGPGQGLGLGQGQEQGQGVELPSLPRSSWSWSLRGVSGVPNAGENVAQSMPGGLSSRLQPRRGSALTLSEAYAGGGGSAALVDNPLFSQGRLSRGSRLSEG